MNRTGAHRRLAFVAVFVPYLVAILVVASTSSRAAPGDPVRVHANHSPSPSPSPPPATKPNVVFILTDDQRWDTLDVMPRTRADIAAHGVTFSNAFVVNSLCCPSRTAILTGEYSHSTGVWTNEPPYGGFKAFHGDSSTVATWLHAAGYQTALIGKYLNQYEDNAYIPPGWDHWFAFSSAPNYYNYDMNRDGTFVHYGSDPGDYSTDVLASDAESFIRNADPAKPLLLYFATRAPHAWPIPAPQYKNALQGTPPWRPPNYSEPDVAGKPEWVQNLAPFNAAREKKVDELHIGMLRTLLSVDDAVDGIVQTLAQTGRLGNTMIVFTSDNGFSWASTAGWESRTRTRSRSGSRTSSGTTRSPARRGPIRTSC